jgi:hypothetical protein
VVHECSATPDIREEIQNLLPSPEKPDSGIRDEVDAFGRPMGAHAHKSVVSDCGGNVPRIVNYDSICIDPQNLIVGTEKLLQDTDLAPRGRTFLRAVFGEEVKLVVMASRERSKSRTREPQQRLVRSHAQTA